MKHVKASHSLIGINAIVIMFSTLLGCAQQLSDSGFRQVVNHPGKIELVYMGYENSNPSRHKALVDGKAFYTISAVMPSLQSVYLLEQIEIKRGESVLDIGTGSGVQAVFAAIKASHVVATDLYQNVIDDAVNNAKVHGVEGKIDFRVGDLFGPIKKTEKFDVIIFNIDYPYSKKDAALWEVHERFFREVSEYLAIGGRIYYQSGWLWNVPKILAMIEKAGLLVMRINMVNAYKLNREPIVFEIKRNTSSMERQPLVLP